MDIYYPSMPPGICLDQVREVHKMKLVKDAIYNYIRLDDAQLRIMDSSQMQRLRHIKQIAMGYLVYPGANHTRFEHSLGTMHLAKKYFSIKGIEEDPELVLAALLHDVGHSAFSHDGEHIFAREGLSHEHFSKERIISGDVASLIERAGHSPRRIAGYAAGEGAGVLITGEVGVDRMDYLARDSYYAGTVHGKVDYEYLFGNVEIEGDRLALGEKGVEAAESLVVSRFLMFSTVYQHKTVAIASGMLRAAMDIAYDEGLFNAGELSTMTDYECMRAAAQSAKANGIMERLLNRRLYKAAVSRHRLSLPEGFAESIESGQKLEQIAEEVCGKCGLERHELVLHYSKSSYKPISMRVGSGAGVRDLSELSPLVMSVREASERKRRFLVAVPQEKKKEVAAAAESIISSYS